MKFVELTEEEFRTFLDSHSNKTFLQTPEMANIRLHFGYKPYYVGVKKDNELLAATMMGAKKSHFGNYEFYAPRGLLIDYKDTKLLSFFTSSLKKFIKAKKGYVLRIDPYYITKDRDIDGNVVENGNDYSYIDENLKKVGYTKSKEIFQTFKYMFSLDLNKEEEVLYKNMHSLPKRMIKKAIENGIIIREANYEELNKIERLINETGQVKNFSSRNLKYYQLLYEYFGNRNEVKFMLGELDVNNYIGKKEENIQKLEQELTTLKKEDKIKECQIKIEKEKECLEEAKKLPEEENGKITLSAAVFILYGDELVYLFGGNKREYMHYGASYLMQWTMIKLGLEKGFKKYNFYGINAPDKKDGVYNFKRGFTGYVEELIGDYELKINNYYYLQKIIKKIRNR